jgi:hypothetical protein
MENLRYFMKRTPRIDPYTLFRRLNSIQPPPRLRRTVATANDSVPVHNPLGHVGVYAPALDCKLSLVLHHFSDS